MNKKTEDLIIQYLCGTMSAEELNEKTGKTADIKILNSFKELWKTTFVISDQAAKLQAMAMKKIVEDCEGVLNES